MSNNIPVKDRASMDALYHEQVRTNRLAWLFGTYLGYESVMRINRLKGLAPGWRFLSMLGFGWMYKQVGMSYYSGLSGPTMGAFLRKYSDHTKKDQFEIVDPKKSYFYIDTSEYMNYSNKTLGDQYHASHGPQPEGEAMDSSYLVEVDKFLRGEENHLKDHKKFYNYPFEYVDKSFPTADAVKDMMSKKD